MIISKFLIAFLTNLNNKNCMKKFIDVLFLGLVVAFVAVACSKPEDTTTAPGTNAPAKTP